VLRDLHGASGPDVHRLLTQVIVPRAVARVMTDAGQDAGSGAERWSLAPDSSSPELASVPPLVGFSVGTGRGFRGDDTLMKVRPRRRS
jgi:hypothetical protein